MNYKKIFESHIGNLFKIIPPTGLIDPAWRNYFESKFGKHVMLLKVNSHLSVDVLSEDGKLHKLVDPWFLQFYELM